MPTRLSDMLTRMIAYDRGARPRTIAEVMVELQAVRQTLGERTQPHAVQHLLERHQGTVPPSRRNYRRMRADLDVHVRPRQTSQDSAVMLLSKIRNLSENGAFVTTDNPMPVGSFVTLEFDLEARKARVHVLGVVRWTEAGAQGTGMGIQFLEVSTSDRKNLQDYVDERMVNEMVRALTRTQMHKAVLRILLCSWGQGLSFDRLVSITGASRVLLQRTLLDFEHYALVRVQGEAVQCLRPATQSTVQALGEALKGQTGA